MNKPTCSGCGAELAPGSRDQTCPRCLLELALKDSSDSADQTAQKSSPPRDLPERIGSYRILELLGEGGMGQVYLAEDTSLERKVALKFLPQEMQADETARKRFQREAKSAAALDHPFICNIHEISEVQGKSFIAMEYVQGVTLKDKIAEGPLPLKNALQTAIEIAEAIEEAHNHNIVHRDLKPSNIMITPGGHVKVMDFGLAKRVVSDQAGSEENQLSTLTKEGSLLGTVPYMSPEQVKGEEVDTRSDIFSFGIILYEMLSAVHPFLKPEAMETACAILKDDPPSLIRHVEKTSQLMERTVQKMLAKEPSERYQDIHEVATNFRRLNDGFKEVWTPSKTRMLLLVSTAVLVVSGVLTAYLWITREDSVPQGTKAPPLVAPFLLTEAIEKQPSWSAVGNLIAFVSDQAGNDDIWICDPSGSNALNLTADSEGADARPVWSSDGQRIAFYSEREGPGIYTMTALGADVRRRASIASGALYTLSLSWAKTGDLVYTDFDSAGAKAIYRLKEGATESECLSCDLGIERVQSGELSPSGKLLVFKNQAIGTRGSLRLAHLPSGRVETLYEGADQPHWSPGGDRINLDRPKKV